MVGRSLTRALAALAPMVAALALHAPQVRAQGAEFSFYGVRFGMTKAEVGQKWLPLSGGAYAVSAPAIKQIRPLFDHEGRLYELSFSVELDFPDDPAPLVRTAFQQTLDEKWKRDAALIVNLATGPEGARVSIIHERIRAGYVKHLQERLSALIQP